MAVESPPRTDSGGVTTAAAYCYGVMAADAARARRGAGLGDAPVQPVKHGKHDELVDLLRELRDRVELRVTAHYREGAILGEVVRENPRVARLREETRGARGPHPLLIELGELVAAELRARTDAGARAVLDRLRRLAVDVEVGEEP